MTWGRKCQSNIYGKGCSLGVSKGSPVPAMGDIAEGLKQPKNKVGKIQGISISHLKAMYSSSVAHHNIVLVTVCRWAAQWDFCNSCAP